VTAQQELEAMAGVATALDRLEPPARARVLRWAADHFDLANVVQGAGAASGGGGSRDQQEQFSDIYAMFEAGTPATEEERALLAGYWLQVGESKASFGATAANAALRQMGIGASNIARAYQSLIDRKPALVQQLSKSGRSKQARKQYRLTAAGLKAAQELLVGEADG
jgi:hypothetical protein